MLYAILIIVLFALMFLPQFATRHLLEKHSQVRKDFPGTGGEFAQHLIGRFQLQGVTVEATNSGDHYDPAARTVRLTEDKLGGKSLTAVVVAAHEVGHAIQHHTRSRALQVRSGYRKYKAPICPSSEVSYPKSPHSFTAQAPIFTVGPTQIA
ncbi:zinc metallopeptidase [Ketobacter sp. MCCC 1A13808]|uniref:zinc metallopeptidase n=1 Tax=Ketobacter sp. MCCC 1A13808 TaxID=2602738 RepID=UPI0012EC6C71|nr:zinc metallopeptidase [Ketobacter sp. MCCC 1A13808]MVF14909.1 zinc metallopeptidase [Ketobacter sp. MCCC 1A13808]